MAQLVEQMIRNHQVAGSSPLRVANFASVAQSVEQGTENPCVGGSIPPRGTKLHVHHKFVDNKVCVWYMAENLIRFLR